MGCGASSSGNAVEAQRAARHPFYRDHPEFAKYKDEFFGMGFDDRKLYGMWASFDAAGMSSKMNFYRFVVGPVLEQRQKEEAAEKRARSVKLSLKQIDTGEGGAGGGAAASPASRRAGGGTPVGRASMKRAKPATPTPKGKFDHLRKGKRGF